MSRVTEGIEGPLLGATPTAEAHDSSDAAAAASCSTKAQSGGKASKQHKGRRHMDDDFMMRLYKIKLCTRTTPHNWKLCPWAHPGETAALRRDPSNHMAEMCPAVRQHQECPHGDGCVYARNTFECWLHPYRYRTTMCSSGEACTRNICFFAHNEQELRMAPDSSNSTQQWALPAGLPPGGDAQLMLHMTAAQQQPQVVMAGGVGPVAVSASGPLPGLLPPAAACARGHGACGTLAPGLSPAGSYSSPLPAGSMAMPWCTLVTPPGCCTPLVTALPEAQQLQVQHMLMQQQQAQAAGMMAYPQASPGSAPVAGVMGYGPLGVMGADLGVSQSHVVASPGGQQLHHKPQYSPAGPTYDISATSGLCAGGGGAATNALAAIASAGPSHSHSAVQLPGLQAMAAGPGAAQDIKWQQQQQQQQQQQAVMQHAAMLLQQLQLSGAGHGSSAQLSTDSLRSSIVLGGSSSSTFPPLSQLSLSDFSSDSLSALLPPGGYPLPRDMGLPSSSALLGGMPVMPDVQLLPLESCGLIQLSALDEAPPAVGGPGQHQQQVTTAMQQPGRYW